MQKWDLQSHYHHIIDGDARVNGTKFPDGRGEAYGRQIQRDFSGVCVMKTIEMRKQGLLERIGIVGVSTGRVRVAQNLQAALANLKAVP